MRGVLCSLYIFGVIDFIHPQYLSLGSNKKPKVTNSCDGSKTALVENFFTLIFNEFHNTPPICVCVQMCPEQPTYCYPNGCLRKAADRKKVRDSPITRVSENTKPLMMFAEDKSDFMGDLLENRVDESKMLNTEKSFIKNLRPDPFKDKYKMIFKYRKSPRVEIRYHHGEQVKNMKLDRMKHENMDVSNSRWPSNKNRRSSNKLYLDQQNDDRVNNNAKVYMPVLEDNDAPLYSSKYFKRDLRNITEEHNEQNDTVDIQTVYVLGGTNEENASFSLESLIDTIIENSFDYTSTTVNTDDNYNETGITEPIERGNTEPIETVVKRNVTVPNNESTNIISINLTNETDDKNMYLEDGVIENNTESYNNMIATLSKKIDLQNNTSMEMMRRVVGTADADITSTTNDDIDDTTQIITTENHPLTDYELKVTKKNKQRFTRKLLDGKIN